MRSPAIAIASAAGWRGSIVITRAFLSTRLGCSRASAASARWLAKGRAASAPALWTRRRRESVIMSPLAEPASFDLAVADAPRDELLARRAVALLRFHVHLVGGVVDHGDEALRLDRDALDRALQAEAVHVAILAHGGGLATRLRQRFCLLVHVVGRARAFLVRERRRLAVSAVHGALELPESRAEHGQAVGSRRRCREQKCSSQGKDRNAGEWKAHGGTPSASAANSITGAAPWIALRAPGCRCRPRLRPCACGLWRRASRTSCGTAPARRRPAPRGPSGRCAPWSPGSARRA